MKKMFTSVKAHCDIPCGIYDPISAQIAALSVIRMLDLMKELEQSDDLTYENKLARYISIKESETEKVKHEIRIIWGDFIKPDMVEKYPNIHALTHKIMALASQARQGASRDLALELLQSVNEFAEIFWEIKGVKTKKIKAHYAPNEDIVVPA